MVRGLARAKTPPPQVSIRHPKQIHWAKHAAQLPKRTARPSPTRPPARNCFPLWPPNKTKARRTRHLHTVPTKVRGGIEIVIEQDHQPAAEIKPSQSGGPVCAQECLKTDYVYDAFGRLAVEYGTTEAALLYHAVSAQSKFRNDAERIVVAQGLFLAIPPAFLRAVKFAGAGRVLRELLPSEDRCNLARAPEPAFTGYADDWTR